jgi:YedE family putative selenium metabolism protein
MLRNEAASSRQRVIAVALMAGVGAAAGWLVYVGNPGNMGICGACFLRDLAGALKLSSSGPAYMRPEIPGLVLGALIVTLVAGKFTARGGGYSAARFIMGMWMAIAALVFLGCPFRMLQRLGGGDLNAWMALPGFVLGVGIGVLLERWGYTAGKTSRSPAPLGLLGPAVFLGVLLMFLVSGILAGPGPSDVDARPAHAPWLFSLAIALAEGAVLSVTGFCAISATRQVYSGPKAMLWAALALIGGYLVFAAITGRFTASFAGQPISNSDWLWNFLSLGLLGLTGVLAGGCPVRQIVMAGEGNSDAFVCVAGLIFGGALAHNFGLVSIADGPDVPGGSTPAGRIAIVVGYTFCVGYSLWFVTTVRQARRDLPAERGSTDVDAGVQAETALTH